MAISCYGRWPTADRVERIFFDISQYSLVALPLSAYPAQNKDDSIGQRRAPGTMRNW
jgi:hypothetical protein